MTETLRPTNPARRYGSHESRAMQLAGRAMGISAAAAGKRVRTTGIHVQTAHLIRAAVETGDLALAERLFAPVESARMGFAPEPVTPALIESEERADAAEGVAQAIYLATPNRDHRRAWIAALRLQRARSLELLVALEGEDV